MQATERIHKLVQSGVESGAGLALDGRNTVVAFIPSSDFFQILSKYNMYSAPLACLGNWKTAFFQKKKMFFKIQVYLINL